MRSIAVIDIDGTITNFAKIDNEIIMNMYSKNKIVMLLDRLLWWINGQDIITNSFVIFRLRILIYSILSFSKYAEAMKQYRDMYIVKADCYMQKFLKSEQKKLESLGYDVMLLSYDCFNIYLNKRVVIVRDKLKYLVDNVYPKYENIHIFGNNYMDDIKAGIMLRKYASKRSNKNVTVSYIGHSTLLKRLAKSKNIGIFNSIEDAIKIM